MNGRWIYLGWVPRSLMVVAGCSVFPMAGERAAMVTPALAAATHGTRVSATSTPASTAPGQPPRAAEAPFLAAPEQVPVPDEAPMPRAAPVPEAPVPPDLALVDPRPLAVLPVDAAAPAPDARDEEPVTVAQPVRPFSDPQPLQQALYPGMQSEQVRALQIRLRHAKVLPSYDADGIFGPVTATAVRRFQRRNDLAATGVVDAPTWDLLLAQSHDPTPAEMSNTDIGPWFVNPRQQVWMMELQDRLRQVRAYAGPIDGELGELTRQGIARYREQMGLPASDVMDERTWAQLLRTTHNPSYANLFDAPPASTMTQLLDMRCLSGKVVCISKQQQRISYVVDGQIQFTRPARFSLPQYDSPEGEFRVWYKNRDTISRKFGERYPMPYAIFYEGDVAVHFSDDFAENGYDGGSHGCSQLDDYQVAKWLYEQVAVGDRVVVY